MINLLPPDVKQGYYYARRNTRLIRWALTLSIALAGLAVLSLGGVFYLNQQATSYDTQAVEAELALQKQNQAGVVREVTEISNNLKLTVQVLSNQVLYSELLKQLATIIPADTALSNLAISQVNGALDITASTADYTAATQLQVNLADPANKLFTKADIVNIGCSGDGAAGGSKYPCTVTVRALFSPDNPYLFKNGTVPAGSRQGVRP